VDCQAVDLRNLTVVSMACDRRSSYGDAVTCSGAHPAKAVGMYLDDRAGEGEGRLAANRLRLAPIHLGVRKFGHRQCTDRWVETQVEG
jgi:hypothetical protein